MAISNQSSMSAVPSRFCGAISFIGYKLFVAAKPSSSDKYTKSRNKLHNLINLKHTVLLSQGQRNMIDVYSEYFASIAIENG